MVVQGRVTLIVLGRVMEDVIIRVMAVVKWDVKDVKVGVQGLVMVLVLVVHIFNNASFFESSAIHQN